MDRTMRCWLVVAALLGGFACGDDPSSWPVGRPRIDAFMFLQQSVRDPYRLEFSVEFEDTDRNLAGGSLELSIDGELADTRPMSEVFQRQSPPLEPTLARGVFDFGVTLSDQVGIGDTFEVGVALVDEVGSRSNEPTVEMRAFGSGG